LEQKHWEETTSTKSIFHSPNSSEFTITLFLDNTYLAKKSGYSYTEKPLSSSVNSLHYNQSSPVRAKLFP